MDTDDDYDLEDECFLLLAYRELQHCQRIQTGQSGQEYIRELLDSAHPKRVHHVLRMQLDTFYTLRDWLVTNADLKGDNITQNLRVRGSGRQTSIEEKYGGR
jgi:hypothetical protein